MLGLSFVLPAATAAETAVEWVCSTATQPWQRMPTPVPDVTPGAIPPWIRIDPRRTFQTMEGFGGCFNELGWVALGRASASDRAQVLAALFGDEGCAFTRGRLPIGASDFALDGYSLDDTPDDLALEHFSLERDRQHLLPYVKAALTVRPTLSCWGSAWSPPAWMKTNRHYSRGELRWEPAILRAYATYLARWVEAYRAEGVGISALFTQNEPNILNDYPTCRWTGPQLREFVADYLGPILRGRKTSVELWLGTLNGDAADGGNNANDRLLTVLADPRANAFITGVSFQYDGSDLIGTAYQLYPDKRLMQSETECNSGRNSWADAQRLYQLMKQYMAHGAGSYFAWNMVLDESGMSTWKWRQNALITVARSDGSVTYHGEYHVMRHFSHYVKPGAKRILSTGPWGDQIAFANPDGSIVLVLGNSAPKPYAVSIAIAGRAAGAFAVTLPAGSISSIRIP